MMRIETNLKNISENLNNHVDEQRIDIKNILDKLDNLNSKFAGKWVEKVSVGVLISVIGGIIIFVITK